MKCEVKRNEKKLETNNKATGSFERKKFYEHWKFIARSRTKFRDVSQFPFGFNMTSRRSENKMSPHTQSKRHEQREAEMWKWMNASQTKNKKKCATNKVHFFFLLCKFLSMPRKSICEKLYNFCFREERKQTEAKRKRQPKQKNNAMLTMCEEARCFSRIPPRITPCKKLTRKNALKTICRILAHESQYCS